MALLALVALLPVVIVCSYVYYRDKNDREPLWALAISFFLGILSVIPAYFLEKAFLQPAASNISGMVFYCFLVVGFSEEISKYFFLRVYSYRLKAFNEPFDGIIYSVMVSMGFAAAENILYVMDGGMGVGIMRAFTAIPAHATFAVAMGYYIGLAKFKSTKMNATVYHLIGLALAVTFHGFYDFFLFTNSELGMFAGAFITLIAGIYFSFKAMRLHKNRMDEHIPPAQV